jgi:hypothetical protein
VAAINIRGSQGGQLLTVGIVFVILALLGAIAWIAIKKITRW